MPQPEATDEELGKLVERVREATGALMRGDVRRYLWLVNHGPDYTLMPPTGGPTRHGFDASPAGVEALETSFAGGGDGDLELEAQYASGDLAVLVGVERQHGPVAGLPDQDWPLRVTLVFRREDSDWRLVQRHADALLHPISIEQLSLLARGSASVVEGRQVE
jgi:ketosteroid isomerase-like protein